MGSRGSEALSRDNSDEETYGEGGAGGRVRTTPR